MANPRPPLTREHIGILVVALLLTAWGGFGLYEGLNRGFSGGLYDPEYRVPGVQPGGLADRSGFKAGDRIISVEGRPIETLGMESRWPRDLVPRIGDSRRFVVRRNDEEIPIDVVFPAPFPAAAANRIKAALIGLAFMGAGVWAFLTLRSRHARALAHIGLAGGASAALDLGPHLGPWIGVQGHVATAASVLMFILLLRFFVTFPTTKAVSRSRTAAWLVYGAWVCLILFLIAELLVHPALYYTTGNVTAPLILAYLVLTVVSIAHTLITVPRAVVRASGMLWILGGLLVAIVGTELPDVLGVRWPAWAGAAVVAAIPLSMLLAVRRYEALEPTQSTSAASPSP